MLQDWTVQITPTTTGQRIFEKCDLGLYSQKRKEYDSLDKNEKSKYKGADVTLSEMAGHHYHKKTRITSF